MPRLDMVKPAYPSAAARYGVALAAVGVALALSLSFRSFIDPNPFLLFFAAVALSSWYGGLYAGLLATLLSTLLSNYFLIEPFGTFGVNGASALRLAVFAFVAILIAVLSEARRRAEQRFAVTLASIGDAVMTTDMEGRITFMNSVAEALTGWTQGDARGRHISEVLQIVNEETRQTVDNPLLRVLREGKVVGLANHTILIARDGSERPIDDSAAPITNAGGQIIGAVLVFRDITERKQAEHERERLLGQAQEAQRNAEAARLRLDNLFNEAPALIAMLRGPTGVCELFNPLFSQLWGDRDVIGKPMREAWPELEGQGYFELVERVYTTGVSEVHQEYPALIDRHNDGTLDEAYFNFVYQAARDVNGAIEGVLIFGVEVTVQVRARLEAEQARTVAEEAVQARDVFFSVAAHELKTPLTSLLGNAQLLQRRIRRDGTTYPERDQRTVRAIADQSQRLNLMVHGLLDIARLQQGQLSIERTPLDLVALVERVVEEMQPSLDQHTIMYDGPSSPIPIIGDELRLDQVFQNLIENAVKYSPAGGEVQVRVIQREAQVDVAIADSGIGIPADSLPQLFQRFYRAQNATQNNIGGMGVGLSVVKEIVVLHGGTIAVESTEGVGSTFTVTLPVDG